MRHPIICGNYGLLPWVHFWEVVHILDWPACRIMSRKDRICHGPSAYHKMTRIGLRHYWSMDHVRQIGIWFTMDHINRLFKLNMSPFGILFLQIYTKLKPCVNVWYTVVWGLAEFLSRVRLIWSWHFKSPYGRLSVPNYFPYSEIMI
jgi:hypothetical protein